MRAKIIGSIGLVIIIGLSFYGIYDSFNLGPYLMGKTQRVNGYIIKKNLIPNGRNVIYRLDFRYSFNQKNYSDHYLSNKNISTLSIGDSIILEVSISDPSKCRVKGYYKKKK